MRGQSWSVKLDGSGGGVCAGLQDADSEVTLSVQETA